MTALIVGCGDLGTEVGLRLHAAGERVIGWRRNPPAGPQPGIEFAAVDIVAGCEWPGADLLVIAAAPGRDDGYEDTYLTGLQHVLQSMDAAGAAPRRALLVSSTAVYGSASGDVDETTPIAAPEGRAAVLLEAERRFLDFFAGSETDAVVLRLGGIYGPGRTRLIDQVREGRAVIPQTPAVTNRIHRDDAAAAVLHLLTRPERPEQLYLGVDDAPAELGDVLRFIADRLGMPEPPAGEVERTRGGARRCSNALLRASGFRFAFPDHRAGYAHLLGDPRPRHP